MEVELQTPMGNKLVLSGEDKEKIIMDVKMFYWKPKCRIMENGKSIRINEWLEKQ